MRRWTDVRPENRGGGKRRNNEELGVPRRNRFIAHGPREGAAAEPGWLDLERLA